MLDLKQKIHVEFPVTNPLFLARAERFELPSTVLETAILPLNYARRKLKAIPRYRNSF